MNKYLVILIFIFTTISCSEQQSSSGSKISEKGLSLEHANEFKEDIIKIADNIYVAVGFALANVIMVTGENESLIIDTTGSEEAAKIVKKEFDKISNKPVNNIFYTHNHPDHIGGATIFANSTDANIYGQENILYNIDNISTIIRPIIYERSARQFGIPLNKDEIIHQGIGGFLEISAQTTTGLLRPTVTFDQNLDLNIDNIEVKLQHVPGETDDHLYVWLPKQEAVMVGDNFYRSFANLYAIRGTKYRNPMEWVHSLDKIRALNAKYLIPSHSRPISGKENIYNALTDYRDAIQFVHDQTVRHMNNGLLPDEIVAKINLPQHLRKSPYLQEFYGSISSYVRSIFVGYIGWFNGNITTLHPLNAKEKAVKMMELASKQTDLKVAAEQAVENGEYQWAMELADSLIAIDQNDQQAKNIKAKAADKFALTQTASNDYYFYKTVAGELRGDFEVYFRDIKATSNQLKAIPIKSIMKSLPVNLNADKTLDTNKKVMFKFLDSEEVFVLNIRRGILELGFSEITDSDLIITSKQHDIKEILAGLKNIAQISLALTDGTIIVEGGRLEFLKTLSYFTD
ncbi:MAG: alkyl sulfatase dimerization domain-containing protein [Candidatus Pelagibacterales bacterium]|jgi:alkyl sulfatase BDS1-like metallo-beta-lactamase superfamily hydrolase|tara:strand:+ start:103 stop:1818 length:1716 start_codon:yes stop_codon:yes gene_type:complete